MKMMVEQQQHAIIGALTANLDLTQRATQECVYLNIQEDDTLMLA